MHQMGQFLFKRMYILHSKLGPLICKNSLLSVLLKRLEMFIRFTSFILLTEQVLRITQHFPSLLEVSFSIVIKCELTLFLGIKLVVLATSRK